MNIHFGLYGAPARVDSHTDPTTEHVMDVSGIVSGSWACWGPADQDTEGDESLHVVMAVDRPLTEEVADGTRKVLGRHLDGSTRILDYAVITTKNWSEVTHIVTYHGAGTRIHSVTTSASRRVPGTVSGGVAPA